MSNARVLRVATDGACAGNPGPAGWGWITEDQQVGDYGSEKLATNQRMELMAVAKALLTLGQDPRYYGCFEELVILTDSRYVVDCMTKNWYKGWIRRDWKTAAGTPVKNQKLWKGIIKLTQAWEKNGTKVTYEWVRGHNGHELNEMADRLAVKGRDEAKKL